MRPSGNDSPIYRKRRCSFIGLLDREDHWAALAAIVDNLLAHETLEGEEVEDNAASELEVILDYIDSRSTVGVLNWLDEYEKTLARIAENPKQIPVAAERKDLTLEVRHAIVKTRHGLPYRVVFVERDEQIVILSVRGPDRVSFFCFVSQLLCSSE